MVSSSSQRFFLTTSLNGPSFFFFFYYSALRTPLSPARKGPLAGTFHEELLATVLKAVVEKSKINVGLIEDVQVGNVLPPGGGATLARMAQLYAG